MFSAPPAPEPSPAWGLTDALGWFVAGLFAQVALASVAVAWFYDGEMPSPQPVILLFVVQLGLWFAYGVGPILTTRLRGNGPVIDLGASLRIGDLGVGLATGIVLQLLVLPVLYWPIGQLVDIDPGQAAEDLVDTVDGAADIILMTIIVAIMAPLVEELFYRGLVLGALRRHVSDVAAIAIQGLLFGAAHFQGIQLPGLIVVGVVFGHLRVRYGRLGPCWAAHFGFNAVTLAVLMNDVVRS